MPPDQTEIFLALGSNLEDRLVNLELAKIELSKQVTITKCSGIYETPPWGYLDQPAFLNQVLAAKTTLQPVELLQFIKSIEKNMGRVNTFRNGPRLIDIDILLFGDLVMATTDLVIPHPRMLERAFVLIPLAEIASDLLVPGSDLAIREYLKNIDPQGIHIIKTSEKAQG